MNSRKADTVAAEEAPQPAFAVRWVYRRLRRHKRHCVTGALAAAWPTLFCCDGLPSRRSAGGSAALLLVGGAGMFAASALRQGLGALSTLSNFRAANGFSLRLRRDAIRHAGHLGADYRSRVSRGQNQLLVERDVELLTDSLHRGIAQIVALFTRVAFAALAVYHFERTCCWRRSRSTWPCSS